MKDLAVRSREQGPYVCVRQRVIGLRLAMSCLAAYTVARQSQIPTGFPRPLDRTDDSR